MAKHGGFGGFPGGGAKMNALLQQAQKMQRDMQNAQQEVEAAQVEGAAGGGLVRVKLSGGGRLQDIEIQAEAVDPEDVDMLQDLILAAFRQAYDEADKLREAKMGRFMQMGAGMGF